MSLEFTYDGSPFAVDVKPSTVQLPQRAEMGDTGNGVVPIDDMAGTVEIVGHKAFLVEESTCSQPRLFTGWTVERDYGRQVEGGLIVEASRVPEVNIVGPSAAAGFRIIWDTDGNRPEETWNDRLAWIVGSDYLGPLIGGDDTFFGSYTQTMDPADYRGSNAGSVLEDLCERTGGVLNWFLFWNPSTSAIELFIKREQYTIGQCTLSISNVEDEVDGITVFAPDEVAKLARESDQTYSEVIVEYGDGQKVYRTLDSTATQFIRRGTTISRPYTKRESTAIAQADQWLLAHSYERDRITCVMRSVPASLVGLVQAGMGIDVKFSHFDVEGYADAPVTMRIVMCSPVPVSDIGDLYDISLELLGSTPSVQAPVAIRLMKVGMAELDAYHGGDECNRFAGTNGLLYWEGIGDAPPLGYMTYVTSGPIEGVNETVRSGYCGPYYTKVKVLAAGTVTAVVTASSIWVGWATLTWSLDVNGVSVDTISNGLKNGGDSITAWTVANIPVDANDLISVSVTVDPLEPAFWAIDDLAGGGGNTHLTVTGTLGAATSGTPIPSPTHPSTTTHTTDPTVDDDETIGYSVGDTWVNTDSGDVFVLTDATDGAAVWVLVSGGGVTDHGALTGLLDDDHTQYVLKRYGGKEVVSTVAATGATETLDLGDGNVHDVTLTADCTFTFAGATNGVACSFTLVLRQDGTGGWTTIWPGSVVWAGGTAPTLDETASTVAVLTFFTLDGGTVWYGFPTGGGGSAVAALDDLTDVTITSVAEDDTLRYVGEEWVNDNRRWEPVTTNPGGGPELVWDGDEIVMNWTEY